MPLSWSDGSVSNGFSWVPWWNRHPAATEKPKGQSTKYPEIAVSSESDEEDPIKPDKNDLASRNILVRAFREDEESAAMLNGLPSRRPSFHGQQEQPTAQPS